MPKEHVFTRLEILTRIRRIFALIKDSLKFENKQVLRLRIKRNYLSAAGFTLIELMLVIVLVGILVTVAVANYSKFHLRAKTAEAKRTLGIIRTCQEAYKLDMGTYVVCPMHPADVPSGGFSVKWTDTQVPAAWNNVGFNPIGKIRYSYEVAAGGTGITDSFTAYAYGDLDEDDVLSTWSITQEGTLSSADPLE